MGPQFRGNSNYTIATTTIFVLLLLVVTVLGASGRLAEFRDKLRVQTVPSGLLDYGEKGKILKHLGLVYGVLNPLPSNLGNIGAQNRPGDSLFSKKREVGEYAYLANPGSTDHLPSSLLIGKDQFREGWPLVSLALDPPALSDQTRGIVPNSTERGVEWERRATVSYFQGDKLRAASSVGVRIHGSEHDREIREGPVKHSYRIYFRNDYGVSSPPPGILFDKDETVRRLVVRRERFFASELAYDIANRLGAETPHYKPAIFYLNGERVGIRSLVEFLGHTEWKSKLGHENFYFYKYRGTTDPESKAAYRELGRWFRNHRKSLDMESASRKVDIHNLTRSLFAYMYCGTNDWYQGAAILDKEQVHPKWYWITWDMDESFRDNWKTSRGALWEQDALAQVVVADSKTGYWRTTYYNFRSALFSRLMNNDPGYRSYFLRTVTDVLNHELTRPFLEERIKHYEAMLENYRDPVPGKEIRQFRETSEFLKRRAEFVRHSLQRRFSQSRFDLGELYRVDFEGPAPNMAYEIDGYSEDGKYSGMYFDGQTIEIRVPGILGTQRWIVNGKSIDGETISLPVHEDLLISHIGG